MLLSHPYRFIFLKTKKTAGTSAEKALQVLLFPDSDPESSALYEGPDGIIGAREQDARDAVFKGHMRADHLREAIGGEMFDSYRKVAIVRNPFDKIVSWFFFRIHAQSTFEADRDEFRRWLAHAPRLPGDRGIFTIKRKVVAQMLRYERLQAELDGLAAELTDGKVRRVDLGSEKTGFRKERIPFQDYYDAAGRDVVSQAYAFELEEFGYTFDRP